MSFTIAEYIQQNKLDVDPRDSAVNKTIAAHLRRLGYSQTRVRKSIGDGKHQSQTVWIKDNRKEMLDGLEAKLKKLEGKAK